MESVKTVLLAVMVLALGCREKVEVTEQPPASVEELARSCVFAVQREAWDLKKLEDTKRRTKAAMTVGEAQVEGIHYREAVDAARQSTAEVDALLADVAARENPAARRSVHRNLVNYRKRLGDALEGCLMTEVLERGARGKADGSYVRALEEASAAQEHWRGLAYSISTEEVLAGRLHIKQKDEAP